MTKEERNISRELYLNWYTVAVRAQRTKGTSFVHILMPGPYENPHTNIVIHAYLITSKLLPYCEKLRDRQLQLYSMLDVI